MAQFDLIKLIMPACDDCNRGTSAADLVSAIVSRWNYSQSSSDHAKLVQAVRHNYPELIAEWTKLDSGGRLSARLNLQKHGVYVPPDAGLATIGPLTIQYLNLFAHKVVLALYFEHFRKNVPRSGGVSAFWRSKEDFAKAGIPQVLLNMMKRYGTLE